MNVSQNNVIRHHLNLILKHYVNNFGTNVKLIHLKLDVKIKFVKTLKMKVNVKGNKIFMANLVLGEINVFQEHAK